MSYTSKVVEIFLSSPSDVNHERDFIVKYASEWNRLRSRSVGCYISILTWEELVAPSLQKRSQEAISDQIGSSYDIYLGMMWTKFGTPTGVAESGTEEEFNQAISRYKSGENIKLASIFKKSPIDPSNIDLDSLLKIRNFKKRISDEGMFYREFSDDDSLRSILNLLFEQIAKDKDKYEISIDDNINRSIQIESNKSNDTAKFEIDESEDDGLIEIGEDFSDVVDEFVSYLQDILTKESTNTEELNKLTQDISDILGNGSVDQSAIKAIMVKTAKSFASVSEKYEVVINLIEDAANKMADLMNRDFIIRKSFNGAGAPNNETIKAAMEMVVVLEDTIRTMKNLIESTDSIPKLSKIVNIEKKRLSHLRSDLLSIFISLHESVSNSIRYFD